MTETITAAEEHRFPCSACGSDLRYAPGTDKLACDHCGNEDKIGSAGAWAEQAALKELDYARAAAGELPETEMEETRVLGCDSCGAQVEFAGAEHAKECPFCATPIVTDSGTHRHIKPAALLPFAVDEKPARDAMTKWLGKLWFAPNGLQEYARKGRRLSGIYVPYWTYDADTRSGYTGERGDDYWTTETRIRDGKSEQVRVKKTRWRRVSGHVARAFDDVLVMASNSLPRSYTDALEPWDLEKLTAYRPEFLAGFGAEGYQVPVDEGYGIGQQKMAAVIEGDVRRDIGGDHQRVHDVNTSYSDVTFKHILLPVWMAAYKYRGKSYRFVINGRTGEVKGERPWSWIKITIAVLITAAVIGAAAYAISLQQ